jgi:hypothetical protein
MSNGLRPGAKMDKSASRENVEHKEIVFYDVSQSVKSWGQRGMLGGSFFGLALGVVFVAVPQADNILTFGVFGTLLVGMVEGAVIAGAFGVCAAALYSKGVLRGSVAKREQTPSAGWRDGDIPLSDWPTMWPHPDAASEGSLREAGGGANPAVHSLVSAQMQLNTLDAWEAGNTGP